MKGSSLELMQILSCHLPKMTEKDIENSPRFKAD